MTNPTPEGRFGRDRTLWPEGAPQEAVHTTGYLDRWWHSFRMGWSFNPAKLRRVNEAASVDATDHADPVAHATKWEEIMRDVRRANARYR